MTDLLCLETLVRELLAREHARLSGTQEHMADAVASCPAMWIVPDLLGLAEEYRDRPTSDLAPMVRRMLMEQTFVDDNGDCVFDRQCDHEVDAQVGLILRVLEQVRQQALHHGLWSTSPACEPYFG